MKQMKQVIYLALFVLAAGCSSQPQARPPVDLNTALLRGVQFDEEAQRKNAEVRLSEAAVSVAHSLQTLAQIEKATHPSVRLHVHDNPDSMNMGQPATIDWTGPIEPVIRKIAKVVHYKLHILGSRPAVPAIASVNSKNLPIGQILRNISFQVHKQADIVTIPRKRVIEIRYRQL